MSHQLHLCHCVAYISFCGLYCYFPPLVIQHAMGEASHCVFPLGSAVSVA